MAMGTRTIVSMLRERFTQAVREKIDNCEDIDVVDSGGFSWFYTAANHNFQDICDMLLAAGVDVNKVTVHGWTALLTANEYHHYDVVRVLLDSGANVDAADNYGRTALMTASYYGHRLIVRMLLDAGADVNKADEEGTTALMRASKAGHFKTVRGGPPAALLAAHAPAQVARGDAHAGNHQLLVAHRGRWAARARQARLLACARRV